MLFRSTLNRLFDAMHCVRERKYRSGAAPERVAEHIAAAREQLQKDRQFVVGKASAVTASRNRLDGAFHALRKKHGQV